MPGPASLVVVDGDQPDGWVAMHWEDLSQIELTFQDRVLRQISGRFSPRLPSTIINQQVFNKLHPGMTANDVMQNHFIGWIARQVDQPEPDTTKLIFEQYNRLLVSLKDGKVRTAIRISHTDEHLNTRAP